MRTRRGMIATRLAMVLATALLSLAVGAITAPAAQALPLLPDCKTPPVPEVPGRGVVGFFEPTPNPLPPPGDPFAANPTTTIYEQYGYAGLRWNTYDLGCGSDLLRAPDAPMGTSIANWVFTIPKTAVAATSAVVGAAFHPDFLTVFDPMVNTVVTTLRHTVFDQWAALVLAAMGFVLIWRSRKASLASSAGAIGWAILVMVLVTVVFRWPLVAGHAADRMVTATLGAVTGGLNQTTGSTPGSASTQTAASVQNALLYQPWLGGEFGDANSEVAKRYGPAIFDGQALTWRQAHLLKTDPAAGQKVIDAKQQEFTDAAAKVKAADPDAYEYLVGRRSDTRVGYALLSTLATLCAIPFLLMAGLLVLGSLIIVRLGVMLFPLFATLGLFPAMRGLVIGVGNTMAAAVINAVIFGIGAAVTVMGMGVILAPSTGLPPWLDVVLVLLLTIVMWVALRPFRRLTLMVSRDRNHFAAGVGGLGSFGRGAARVGGRVITTATGTFLGTVGAAGALGKRETDADQGETSETGAAARAEGATVVAAGAGAAAGAASAAGNGSQGSSGSSVQAVGAGASAGAEPRAVAGPAPPAPTPNVPVANGAHSRSGDPARVEGAVAGAAVAGAAVAVGRANGNGLANGGGLGSDAGRYESANHGSVPTGVGTWRPAPQSSDRLPEAVDPPPVTPEEYDGADADSVYRPEPRDAALSEVRGGSGPRRGR